MTLVQVREKNTDTGEVGAETMKELSNILATADSKFIEVARRTKEICDKVSRPRFASAQLE